MINEYKVDKIAGFIYRGLQCHYSYNEIWNLLLNSTPGKKILNAEYTHIYHTQGATSFLEAANIKREPTKELDISFEKIELLAEFIELAHEKGIPYETMFTKESLDSFMLHCQNVLGWYDEKLIIRIV